MQRKENELLGVSVLLVILSSAFLYLGTRTLTEWRCLPVSTGVACAVLALVCLDIRNLSPANSHSTGTLLRQYALILMSRTAARLQLWKFKKDSRKCKQVQEDLLLMILKQNADCDYGRQHEFHSITSREEFTEKVPLATYANFRSYLERMTQGERKVLTAEEVVFFGLSSGTSGTNKTIPVTKGYRKWVLLRHMFLAAIRKNGLSLKRSLNIVLYPPDRYAPCGVPMSSITVHLLPLDETNIVPTCITKLHREYSSYYVQAVFALRERELGNLGSSSTNTTYYFFRFIEQHWQELCRDIERGQLDEDLDIPAEIREELDCCLQPDKARADELLHEFSLGFAGISKKIWPGIERVFLSRSGGFAHPAKLLEEIYLKGVSLASAGYVSSEGLLGFVVGESADEFTLTPYDTFLEFIPADEVLEDHPKTYFADQLQVGKCYEVVLTNTRGLYRYRLGDIIKVVGFYNQLPNFTFEFRLGQELNVAFEHTPEKMVYESLKEGIRLWSPGVTLIDYTATESFVIESVTGKKQKTHCYFLFVEIISEDSGVVLTDEHAKQLDDILCQRHLPYKACRDKGSLDPVGIVQVRCGTFEELRHRLCGQYQNQQFKMPRVIRASENVQFLLDQNIQL